jgi:hypothetical protein
MRQPDKKKLEELIAKLDSGKAVSLRDIQFNLGEEGLNKYNKLWNTELERRKFFEVKPTQIQDYDALVKEADFANNKHQPNTKHPKPTKHYQLCIDLHKNISEADIALAQWFDRQADEATADVLGVARLVTSRSELKRTSAICETKETIKRRLLIEAVNKIEADEKAFSDSEDGKKLKLMLADLMGKSTKW